jgi:hypothetical protein
LEVKNWCVFYLHYGILSWKWCFRKHTLTLPELKVFQKFFSYWNATVIPKHYTWNLYLHHIKTRDEKQNDGCDQANQRQHFISKFYKIVKSSQYFSLDNDIRCSSVWKNYLFPGCRFKKKFVKRTSFWRERHIGISWYHPKMMKITALWDTVFWCFWHCWASFSLKNHWFWEIFFFWKVYTCCAIPCFWWFLSDRIMHLNGFEVMRLENF